MANRYFLNIGVNWGDSANWSDSSGGTGGFSVPTSADDVFFDANSGDCTVNTTGRTAKTLDFTGYTNTITMTFSITVSGNVTLDAGMTIAGASGLTVQETSTITSNGKTFPNTLTLAGTNKTFTLGDNWIVSGSLILSGVTSTTINNNNINIGGSLTITNNAGSTGTTNIILDGTGTWSHSATGQLKNNLTINTPNTITISGTVYYNTGTLTYTAGTVTTTGSTLSIGASTTLNTSGMSWNNITFTGGTTTLTSDCTATGTLTMSGSTPIINGAFNLNVGGDLTIGLTTGIGTAIIVLNGTGTWTVGSGQLRHSLTINTLGTITISGQINYNTGTLNYIAGTIKANTAILNVAANSTFINCDKINFKAITITAGRTITLNKFFSGSAIQPTRISSTGANYTIAFQDGFEKITKFTKISNCTVTNRGQLLCITDKSNKGGNVGVRYINQLPNGVAKNAPTVAAAMAYSVANISDPNFILN